MVELPVRNERANFVNDPCSHCGPSARTGDGKRYLYRLSSIYPHFVKMFPELMRFSPFVVVVVCVGLITTLCWFFC